jgi:hypothetical protein
MPLFYLTFKNKNYPGPMAQVYNPSYSRQRLERLQVETFPGKMFMRPHLKWHTPLIGKNKYKD